MGRLAVLIVSILAAFWLTTAPALAADGPLAEADVKRYRDAFAAVERGDFDAAEDALARIKDRSLEGHVAFQKLMHPTAYKASYDDLAAWLADNSDLGGAERVYALAQKRQPRGSKEPKAPSFLALSREWTGVETVSAGADRSFAARDAYYSGETTKAWLLAPSAGEPWIAGLAGWRLGHVPEARRYFLAVAQDDGADDWMRAAAWFWAARCAERLGDHAQAQEDFRRAAASPYTFYGLLAARKVEMTPPPPATERRTSAIEVENPLLWKASTRDRDSDDGLVGREPRARRAAALVQIGRTVEAAQELRVGLALARTESERRQWQALIIALKVPLQVADAPPTVSKTKPKRRPYRAETYDVPELWPEGGFTFDRALIYALVRQESRFNPYAMSGAGAIGLMQVMPASAARAAGDDKLMANVMPLFDPPLNLRVGQDYMTWIIERGLGGDDEAYDLFRVIAAYNAGAGAVLKTRKRMEPTADALLFIESLPARETRDYVEKVAFGYWTYRRMWGQPTATLDAAVRYDRLVDMRIDR